jgi:excisionase family DNA binding protein
MRSLQDWTRYLEQQEQDVAPASRTPEARVEEAPAPPPPKHIEQPRTAAPSPAVDTEGVPAFLRVETETPVEQSKPEKPEAARSTIVQPVRQARPAQPVEKGVPTSKPAVERETIAKAVKLRKRLPVDVSAEAIQQREIAGASYKTFKESREELIQRLVDPVLSLEEVARILNVCPTTVRRYTNRGALAHHRTAGNQRRFRLSDVLAFLEQQSGVVQD